MADRGPSGRGLLLRETEEKPADYFSQAEWRYTGRSIKVRVTYKLDGDQFGIKEGYCILSIQKEEAKGST